MNELLAKVMVERIRQRDSEGDCPVTPAYSVEALENLVITLADKARFAMPAPRGLTQAEQKAQGERCSCRGSDEMCPCQNVPAAEVSREAAKRSSERLSRFISDVVRNAVDGRSPPAEGAPSGAQRSELSRSAQDEPCNSPPSDHVGGEG